VSFYRRNLPHYQRDYKPHFVTFVTKDRHPLPTWARDIVLHSCLYGHDKKFNLRVVVVMPDHAHLIITPATDVEGKRIYPLHEIMRVIKSHSARLINEHFGKQSGHAGRIWQQESFDHVLRSSESLDAKVAYILANPVRAGLVNVQEDYPWSWVKPIET
jgi:REP element-mobilizing transposase RayT